MKRMYPIVSVLAVMLLAAVSTAVAQQDASDALPENPRGRYQYFMDRVQPTEGAIHPGAYTRAYEEAVEQLHEISLHKRAAIDDYTWVNRGPFNIGGRITAVTVNPLNSNTILIGAAAGGIWRSFDAGASWHSVSDEFPTQAMGAIAMNPIDTNIIYAGTGEVAFGLNTFNGSGVYKSEDGGTTWAKSGVGSFPEFARVGDMAINPVNPNTLYAAVGDGSLEIEELGIWRTGDAGATWENILSGRVTDVEINPKNPLELYTVLTPVTGGFFPMERFGMYKTTDGGDTWFQLDLGIDTLEMGRTAIRLCEDQPNVLYAAVSELTGNGRTYLIGLYKSEDGGDSWRKLEVPFDYMVSQGWYDNVLGVHPTNPDIVYAGGVKLLVSTDGGDSWTRLRDQGAGGLLHVDQHAITFDPNDPNRVLVGNDGGLYLVTNNADVAKIDRGMSITQFIGGGMHPSNEDILYGGTQDNGTLFSELTPEFTQLLYADGGDGHIDQTRPNRMWATQQWGRLFRSDDHGKTWYRVNGDMPNDQSLFYTPFAVDPVDQDVIYYCSGSMYKTTNAGRNWDRQSRSLFPSVNGFVNTISAISIAPYDNNVVMAGARLEGRVAVTTNGGEDWSVTTDTLLDGYCSGVRSFAPGEIYATFSTFGVEKLMFSADTGSTWQSRTGNLPDVPANDVWLHDGTLFLGTAIGIFASEDDGATWTLMRDGIPSVPVLMFERGPNGTLRAYTHGRGMYDLRLEEPNDAPPVFASRPDTTTLEFSQVFRYTPVVEAYPPATYTLLEAPSKANFDPRFGAIEWRGSDLMARFTIQAENIHGSATQTFTIWTNDVVTADWDVISTEKMPTEVRNLHYAGNNTLWVARDSAGVSRSSDGGYTWEHFKIIDDYRVNTSGFFALDPTTAFAGTRAGDLMRTDDGGKSWQRLLYRQGRRIENIYFWNSQEGIYISTGAQDSADVMLTTNGGEDWELVMPRHAAFRPEPNTLTFLDRIHGYYAIWHGDDDFCRIMRTSDGGRTWAERDVKSQSVNELVMFDTDLGYFVDDYTGEIFRTTSGIVWSERRLPMTWQRNVSINLDPTGTMLWIVNDSIAWVSRDQGSDWTPTMLVPTNAVADAEFADEANGWVISKDGTVQRLRFNPLPVERPGAAIPAAITLGDAYPNPVQASSAIHLPVTLSKSSDVVVTVVNSAGKHIQTLHEGSLRSGEHVFTWNPGEVAPGAYFYNVRTATSSAIGRITVLR
ncbi:MAG: hypothetical protein CL946_05890 [Ectothiorhodospiraceae bacterium]|nr:hypothetical protein [Ectothiorhodospiraceae bacterium]